MDSTHNRRFIENHPDLVAETVTSENADNYQIVLDSVQYTLKYSGGNQKKFSAIDETNNPLLDNEEQIENSL